MRILHTADWHLGHNLHDQPRHYEHARFLDWLTDLLEAESVHVLLVAGDVFDTSNPSADAQALWFRFLGDARRRRPGLQIVVIGGNHDSAGRLDAPSPLLDAFGVHVVGGASFGREGPPLDRLLVPLHEGNEVRAWVAAVPFLRPADLPTVPADDPLVAGVHRYYEAVLDAARARRQPGQAIVAMGHLYLTGTRLSELSERRILGGNQHALPAELFPDDVTYTALGHLHLAQTVARETVRYAGSPIPLSMAEADYPHQVLLVDLDGEAPPAVRPVRVPRSVEVLRVPMEGPADLEPVLEMLGRLEVDPPQDGARPAWLEVRVRLDGPVPDLRAQLEAALGDAPVRLVKITTERTGSGQALADAGHGRSLSDLAPEEIFRRRWARDHEGEPPKDLLEAYDELCEAARRTLEEEAA